MVSLFCPDTMLQFCLAHNLSFVKGLPPRVLPSSLWKEMLPLRTGKTSGSNNIFIAAN